MALSVEVIKTGVAEEIGFRESYEDEYAIYRVNELSFFSAEIYDGHGGSQAALIAAEMLTPYFLHLFKNKKTSDLNELFLLVEEAYLKVDTYLIEKGISSGTTAATFYILGERFIASNVGDTRIIIGTRESFRVLTQDHKPYLPQERSRIEKMGGRVITYDIPRVQGVLAISRALGDPSLKPYVIPHPRIVGGFLSEENDYVIIACDGVWDVLEPENVIRIARSVLDPQDIANRIMKEAMYSGSTDNITVIVVDLRDYTREIKREYMEVLRIWEYKG
ncbi:MAG: protein phosphatase 2C domain-containing protein [Deltaproteobacteria bacterium]|nr:protein phosphatase 2C domain-containing protein [Deltaproteobacteria bacterium]